MKSRMAVWMIVLVSLVAVACAPVAGRALPEPREVWVSQDIDNYRFTLNRACFCLPRGPVVIEVRDGEVVSVVDSETGEPTVADQDLSDAFADYATMDRLFNLIDEAEAQDAATLRVTYNETYGYPEDIYIDYEEQVADDEFGYTVSDFEVISE